jgi:hypothetical protein
MLWRLASNCVLARRGNYGGSLEVAVFVFV